MCSTTLKTPPVVDELPTLSIRDLVAEDLIVKAVEDKAADKGKTGIKAAEKLAQHQPRQADHDTLFISMEEYLNGSADTASGIDTPVSSDSSTPVNHCKDSTHTETKVPRVKRHYFQRTVESVSLEPDHSTTALINSTVNTSTIKESNGTSPTSSNKSIAEYKCTPDSPAQIMPGDVKSSALPASGPATIAPARHKKPRKPNSGTTSRRALPSSFAIDMDLMKYGGAIDDLAAAFAGTNFGMSKVGDVGRKLDEASQKKANADGGRNHSVELIGLGMSD
jgi:hypothetical protein